MFKREEGKSYLLTFVIISTLFLLWGTCNGMIDVMDKHFQDYLHLSKEQSAWVQFAHYLGYLLMSLPASWLARKLGYKGGIISGLLLVSLGGFWFIPATSISAFWAFLLGVCIIAMGLTILETVANPYTTVLGPKTYAATRINIAQSFNGIGWILGPIIGGTFFYSAEGADVAQGRLYVPYVVVAAIVLVMALIFYVADVPDLNTEDEYHLGEAAAEGSKRSIWSHPHFSGAVAAQFLYVAAQAGIFSFFINYVISEMPPVSEFVAKMWPISGHATHDEGVWRVAEQGASALQGFVAFGCFTLGRFIGSALLKRFPAHKLLGTYCVINMLLCGVVMLKLGWISVAAVFGTFFFMSIGFPTIFALGIHGLGSQAKKRASAFIVMSITGGALMPKIMGHLGDVYNMSIAFLMPLCCFLLMAAYSFSWGKLSQSESAIEMKASGGH